MNEEPQLRHRLEAKGVQTDVSAIGSKKTTQQQRSLTTLDGHSEGNTIREGLKERCSISVVVDLDSTLHHMKDTNLYLYDWP
jgi:hypothetical protein